MSTAQIETCPRETTVTTMHALVYHGRGKPVLLHMEKLWDRNATLTTRLVDTATMPMLLQAVESGKLEPGKLVTHRFAFDDILRAYDTFGNAAKHSALKVVLANRVQ